MVKMVKNFEIEFSTNSDQQPRNIKTSISYLCQWISEKIVTFELKLNCVHIFQRALNTFKIIRRRSQNLVVDWKLQQKEV